MPKKEEDIEIGNRIRRIRNELNMDQKDFAKKIGATVSALSNWENGRNKPKMNIVNSIAEMSNTDPYEILYGNEYILLKNKILKAHYPNDFEENKKMLINTPWLNNQAEEFYEIIKNNYSDFKIDDLYIGFFETDVKGKFQLGVSLKSKDAIKEKLREILSLDKKHIVDEKALENTVKCFQEIDIPIDDMDLITIYMQNKNFNKSQNTYLIDSKESYINFLTTRIKASEYKLKEEDLSLMDRSVYETVLKVDEQTLEKIR